MDNFLEQYGKIIVVIVVIIALVAVAVFFRDPIKNMFVSLFNSFATKALDGTGVAASPIPAP